MSTFQLHEGKTAENLEYFKNGIGATYVQPVFRSPITGRLTMVISTPIRNDNAQVVAVLAARLNLSRFFNLINETVGLGTSGETVVGKLIGNEIVLMAPTRHAPNAALDERVTIGGEFGMAMQKAAAGQRGNDRTVDYRDQCVYAAWERIPSLNWALAVKLDCSEALEPAQMAFDTLMRLLFWVSLLALVAALFVAHALVAPLNALRNAADSISRGNFDVSLPIPPGDEMGDLAESFERMIAAIKFFREQVRPEDEADLSGEKDAELIGESGEGFPPATEAEGVPPSEDLPKGESK
jgi:HAMP domain-containing protein